MEVPVGTVIQITFYLSAISLLCYPNLNHSYPPLCEICYSLKSSQVTNERQVIDLIRVYRELRKRYDYPFRI